MKLILENWKKYLEEHDEPEEGGFEEDEPVDIRTIKSLSIVI